MADLELLGFDGYDLAVANLPRSRQFCVERMDFVEATEREQFLLYQSPIG